MKNILILGGGKSLGEHVVVIRVLSTGKDYSLWAEKAERFLAKYALWESEQ